MARFNFCSYSYQSLSPNIDAEWSMNLYPEAVESPNGRSAVALVPTDGLKLFTQLNSGFSARGLFTFSGRTFTVLVDASNNLQLTEINFDGTTATRGNMGAAGANVPAIFAANPTQLVVSMLGTGNVYVLSLATNAFTTVALNASSVGYLDGFFVALIADTNSFQVSALEDGTTWPGINTATISEFPDPAVGMAINDRTIFFLGQKQSVPYYNSGALFPFVPVPGAFIEEGAGATYAITKLDNTFLFIGGNVDQGVGIAYRLNGYTSERISNHPLETIWQSYPTIADAVGYTYQTRGHKFWHIYFPTANASWRYDIATGSWCQVGSWNPVTGQFTAHKSQAHTFNFGMHLVADPFSANIYSMSIANLTDNGAPIRRVRRAPYIAKEHEEVFHRKLEVLCETGLPSNIPAASPNPQAFNIADSTGVLWQVTINDAGAMTVAAAPAGQGATGNVVLADNVNQITFWQLQVSVLGVLSGIQVQFGSARAAIFAMGTQPTLPNVLAMDTGLEVNQAGVVSAVPPTAHLRAPQLELRWSDDGGHTCLLYTSPSPRDCS